MPTQVDRGTRQRCREKFSKLIWDQVLPFAYLDRESVELRSFEGKLICYPDLDADGARELFWGNYIEPFLEELCRSEIAEISDPAMLRRTREELIEGFIRIYWVMADMHRSFWPRPFLVRRDTADKVGRMVAYLDDCIARRAA